MTVREFLNTLSKYNQDTFVVTANNRHRGYSSFTKLESMNRQYRNYYYPDTPKDVPIIEMWRNERLATLWPIEYLIEQFQGMNPESPIFIAHPENGSRVAIETMKHRLVPHFVLGGTGIAWYPIIALNPARTDDIMPVMELDGYHYTTEI